MRKAMLGLVAAALVLGARAPMPEPSARAPRTSAKFAVASVRFEQNLLDQDVEAVFEVKGGTEGLAHLTIVAPDGRTVLSYEAPDAESTLGLRTFRFESPEPRDAARLKAAYPEGAYTFAGWTAAGDTLFSNGTLSHRFPGPSTFVRPKAGATGVTTSGLEISWAPVKNISAYIVKLEQEERGETIEARVPASVVRFAVPNGFLRAGTEYVMSVGTVSDNGNASFIEGSFTTAGKVVGH